MNLFAFSHAININRSIIAITLYIMNSFNFNILLTILFHRSMFLNYIKTDNKNAELFMFKKVI